MFLHAAMSAFLGTCGGRLVLDRVVDTKQVRQAAWEELCSEFRVFFCKCDRRGE